MGWYVLVAVVMVYVIPVTYLLWNLLGDYAELQEREDRLRRQFYDANTKREHYENLAKKHGQLLGESEAELALAKRELEIVSKQYDDVQEQRVELAKALDATHEELMHANNLAAQRGDQLEQCQELLNERLLYNQKLIHSLSQIREICNT